MNFEDAKKTVQQALKFGAIKRAPGAQEPPEPEGPIRQEIAEIDRNIRRVEFSMETTRRQLETDRMTLAKLRENRKALRLRLAKSVQRR